jgi:lipid-A-disaccharide synthase-like uncharacterized protein
MKLIGLVGLFSIAACWVPQTLEVLKTGQANMKLSFLILYLLGSIALTIYALGDAVFVTLNLLTTVGSAINLYYKILPKKTGPAGAQ